MSGTKEGGKHASETNYKKYGKDYYKRIGTIGGTNGRGPNYEAGFRSTKVDANGLTGHDRAVKYGIIGGRKSKRGPTKQNNTEEVAYGE